MTEKIFTEGTKVKLNIWLDDSKPSYIGLIKGTAMYGSQFAYIVEILDKDDEVWKDFDYSHMVLPVSMIEEI